MRAHNTICRAKTSVESHLADKVRCSQFKTRYTLHIKKTLALHRARSRARAHR